MTVIRVLRFGGLQKQVTDRNIRETGADLAHNAELRDGSLRAFRAPDVAARTASAVDAWEMPHTETSPEALIHFDHCVTMTWPADPGRDGLNYGVIWHEDGTPPERIERESGRRWPLIVRRPTGVPKIERVTDGALKNNPLQSPDERVYVYTWVDRFGAESPPSQPSRRKLGYDDQTWQVRIDETPPSNVVAVRIYRTSAEFGNGTDPNQTDTTTFQLVRERDVATLATPFVDSLRLRDMDFGTLDTITDMPPPEGMQGVAETEAGYHVGFRGREVFFSERHEPHNWPVRSRVTLPYEVRGIAVNNDIVYVGTGGPPFRLTTAPRADDLTGDTHLDVDVRPYDQTYPMAGRRTIVATAWGAMYVGREGLIALQPQLPARVFTRQVIDEDRWVHYAPNRIAWVNGRLYASRAPHGPGFVLDVRGEPEGPRDFGELVTVDLSADTLRATPTGRLIVVDGGDISYWDSDVGVSMTYQWRSRRFVPENNLGFHAAKVVARYGAPVIFRLYQDNRLIYDREVRHNRPFRLPHRGKGSEFQIEVEGTTQVHEVFIATSMAELAQKTSQAEAE